VDGVGLAPFDQRGRYVLDGLGPYAWPVEFGGRGDHAWQWSGGVASRRQATLIKVRAGGTATADEKLTKSPVVRGTVSRPDGAPDPFTVVVVNADTGDAAGGLFLGQAGTTYEIPVLPQKRVGNSPVTVNLVTF
jgi:hypothetical protein